MTLTAILVLIALGGAFVFVLANPRLRQKLGMTASIKAEEVVDNMTTAIEREKAAVKAIADKIPAQRQRVAKNQARVDAAQRQYDGAVKHRDELSTKYKTLKGRVSEDALNKIALDYEAAKKTVAEFEANLSEAKKVADESERTVNEFEQELARAARNISTDEGRADLAAAYRDTAALRNEVKDLSNGLSTISEARKQIESDLDVARHLNENSQGSKTDREIKNAEDQLAAEQARKELEGDLGGNNNTK